MDPANADPPDAGAPTAEGPGSGLTQRCATCGGTYPLDFRVCPRDATPLGVDGGAGDPLLGAVLGGSYRIRRLLTRGGMSRVYEADHVRLGRPLIAKVMHEHFVAHPDAVARFEREARAAGSIDCPHVVSVVDILRTPDGRPTLIAEALAGEDLQRRLDREGRLAPADAVRVARQMCLGVASAHALGIVHRDIKPSNVFLAETPDGREVVKLLDFGVAKLAGADDLTRTGAVVGTPAFMAPEQARGAAAVDARADVYGVGAVLYRMVTGSPPYASGDTTATLGRLLHREPPRPRDLCPSLSIPLEAVIQRAMARDVSDRYPSADALGAALAGLAAPDEPGSELPQAVASLERDARLARPSATLAGAALFTLTFAWSTAVLAELGAVASAPGWSVRLLASVAALIPTVLWVRDLRARWPSAPAIAARTRRLGRALGAGLVVAGALTMLGRAAAALDLALAFTGPGVFLAATAGAAVLAWWLAPRA